MQKLIKIVFIFAIPFIAFSCGQSTKKKQDASKTEQTIDSPDESENVLTLDNGKLWSANSETTSGIKNMISLMNFFEEKDNLNAYAALNKNLEKEFGTIISKCTMKGEAHNQLHNYLVPMKSLIKGLKSSELNICKENYNKLNIHLAKYITYFK